ncbi:MAG TPA: Gldg family protein, partial [Gemmatimonadales bacterium]
MKRIWTVALRELKALFDYPTAYVLLVVFLAVNAFLFFRQAYIGGAASLRPMLDLLPWVFLFFVPAVTMRTVAEDSRSGVLEVVLAQPLTELELVTGKYLGSVLFLWIALALTVPIPLALSVGADMQWGPIVAQYVGSALLAAGLAGVGIWASSIASSQMTAFIISVVVMFVLVLFGLDPLIVGLPPSLGAIAARLGVLSHFDSISRGVIDLRDAIYFLSLAGLFLALAYGTLVRRRLAPGGAAARRLRLGVGLLAATLVAVNLLGSYIRGRLDLTPGHAYTLSPATEQIVRGLDDIVTIKLFASKELPTEAALLKRDVDDLLHDLKAVGGDKVRIVQRDPAENDAARRDAQALGIQPVQFNVIGQSELQVKEGFLGLAIQHADGNDVIPFVSQTEDLEYRLASSIRSLTRTKKPVVGIVNEVKQPEAGMQALREQLTKGYEVRGVSLGDSNQVAGDISLLILAGNPDSLPTAQLDRLNRFFDRGGSALVLASGMELSPQMPMAMPKPVGWNSALQRFGVSVRSDMVYDLQAAEIVPVPSDAGRVLRLYPFFIRGGSTGKSVINEEVGEAVFTWASS